MRRIGGIAARRYGLVLVVHRTIAHPVRPTDFTILGRLAGAADFAFCGVVWGGSEVAALQGDHAAVHAVLDVAGDLGDDGVRRPVFCGAWIGLGPLRGGRMRLHRMVKYPEDEEHGTDVAQDGEDDVDHGSMSPDQVFEFSPGAEAGEVKAQLCRHVLAEAGVDWLAGRAGYDEVDAATFRAWGEL